MSTSQQAPLHTTFLTSQACMAVSIDTRNAPARFIGHLCWDARNRVYVLPGFNPYLYPSKSIPLGVGMGLDDNGEVTIIAPNSSKYVIFVSPLFFLPLNTDCFRYDIILYTLPKCLQLPYYPKFTCHRPFDTKISLQPTYFLPCQLQVKLRKKCLRGSPAPSEPFS